MRNSVLTIISFLATLSLSGQTSGMNDLLISRLYTEVAENYDVQSKYIGCYGSLSAVYKKADSLKTIAGLNTFVSYFNDQAVNIRYYSFVEMLALDDQLAFEKIKELSGLKDSISFLFAGQNHGKVKLVELLLTKYLQFIKMKYYYGGVCCKDGRCYTFGSRNKRKWKQIKAAADQFISAHNLSGKFIADYSG